MPRGHLSKNDVLAKVYQRKTELYDGRYESRPGQWQDGAHHAYNTILDILNEYSN